jgi:hypothetical protein
MTPTSQSRLASGAGEIAVASNCSRTAKFGVSGEDAFIHVGLESIHNPLQVTGW